ncbi:peptidoglycan editing factor PgeF [Neobacillus sp. PS3-34]|uniref:peptidoglycan editing factor PgeF n=1 Tax=Neobacillus sp. PS3-34 TaxID=3070678 RepID=UPI0027E110E6|nr:peptidoglycan editing factor PgeF [Neobacillus sp. PS3-34]WML49334.1 peptidoglycan editing factor PgeF [Neobacillus sp. PS3-34]
MEPFILKNDSFLLIDSWMDKYPGLIAGMTTKNGGYSKNEFESFNMGFHVNDNPEAVCANRKHLAELLAFPLESWAGAEQTHDVTVQKVTSGDRGKGASSYGTSFKATDAFYTDEKGILLTLCFADCVPLFFIAPHRNMIGTAHAGWKGTVNEISRHMIEAWKNEGIQPEQIFAVIGPSICGKCYIVDERVITFVQNTLEDVEKKPYNTIKAGQYALDLQELNKLLMIKAGIPEANISVTKYCSSCHQDLFFSHRRDHGKTGRMTSFVGWKEEL